MMKTVAQIERNTGRVKPPSLSTRSMFDKNLSAAASSKNPMKAFAVTIQPPDFGRRFIKLGNIARSRNGSAKTVLNPIIPIIG